MDENVKKKVLEHPCINCSNCRGDWTTNGLYCEATKRSIHFYEDIFRICPKLYMAYQEMSHSHYEQEDLVLTKENEILKIDWYYYDHKNECYKYHSMIADRDRVRHFSYGKEVKHEDIVKKVFIKNDKYVDENGVLV